MTNYESLEDDLEFILEQAKKIRRERNINPTQIDAMIKDLDKQWSEGRLSVGQMRHRLYDLDDQFENIKKDAIAAFKLQEDFKKQASISKGVIQRLKGTPVGSIFEEARGSGDFVLKLKKALKDKPEVQKYLANKSNIDMIQRLFKNNLNLFINENQQLSYIEGLGRVADLAKVSTGTSGLVGTKADTLSYKSDIETNKEAEYFDKLAGSLRKRGYLPKKSEVIIEKLKKMNRNERKEALKLFEAKGLLQTFEPERFSGREPSDAEAREAINRGLLQRGRGKYQNPELARIPFGKYKGTGKTLADIYAENPGYIAYIYDKIANLGSSEFRNPKNKRRFEKFMDVFQDFSKMSYVQNLLKDHAEDRGVFSPADLHRGKDQNDPKTWERGKRSSEPTGSGFAVSDSQVDEAKHGRGKGDGSIGHYRLRRPQIRRDKDYDPKFFDNLLETEFIHRPVRDYKRKFNNEKRKLIQELAPFVPMYHLQMVYDEDKKDYIQQIKITNRNAELRSYLFDKLNELRDTAGGQVAETGKLVMQAEKADIMKSLIFDRELAMDYSLAEKYGQVVAQGGKLRFVDKEKVTPDPTFESRYIAAESDEARQQVEDELHERFPRKALELSGHAEKWDALKRDHLSGLAAQQAP